MDASFAQAALDRPQVEVAVRDESVQAQQRLAVDLSERIPACSGAHEKVEVVLLVIGVVEVAGRSVRRALPVSTGEALEHHGAQSAPGQLPCGRESHHAAADHGDLHRIRRHAASWSSLSVSQPSTRSRAR